MQNRILKEEVLASDELNKLSWEEEAFFHRLLLVVDKCGRYHADPTILIKTMPLRDNGISILEIERLLTACVNAGLVSVYEAEGKRYLEVLHFKQITKTI